MNPVVEAEYAYLIQRAARDGDDARVKALEKGLERARRKAMRELELATRP